MDFNANTVGEALYPINQYLQISPFFCTMSRLCHHCVIDLHLQPSNSRQKTDTSTKMIEKDV